MLVWPVASVAADVTCTGVLVVGENEELIVDADRTCSVSTRGSGHDPLKPCTLGQQCRVTGTYSRKIDQFDRTLYVVRTLKTVDAVR